MLALLLTLVAAGEFDGQLSADLFRGEANGAQKFDANDVGLNLKARLYELDRRLHLKIDYRGREPVEGSVQSDALRLLYQAEIGYAIVEETFTLSIGRFVADAPVFLPVDALRVDLEFSGLELSMFGGRRAMTSSRRNVNAHHVLPAVGGSVRYRHRLFWISLDGAFARDQLVLISQSDAEVIQEHDAGSAMLNAAVQPLDGLLIGGSATFAQRAAYVLGPSWRSARLEAKAFNFWSGVWFVDYEILVFSFADTGSGMPTELTGPRV